MSTYPQYKDQRNFFYVIYTIQIPFEPKIINLDLILTENSKFNNHIGQIIKEVNIALSSLRPDLKPNKGGLHTKIFIFSNISPTFIWISCTNIINFSMMHGSHHFLFDYIQEFFFLTAKRSIALTQYIRFITPHSPTSIYNLLIPLTLEMTLLVNSTFLKCLLYLDLDKFCNWPISQLRIFLQIYF